MAFLKHMNMDEVAECQLVVTFRNIQRKKQKEE
jgi:hypothetical protein